MASINNYVSSTLDFSGIRSLKSGLGLQNSSKIEINKKVAMEFEAMFLRQLTDSMQAALEPFKSDLINNDSINLFEDLFYDEVAHYIPQTQGLGIYQWLNNLDQRNKLIES